MVSSRQIFGTLAALLLLAGCGSPSVVVEGDPVASPYDGPMQVPVSNADAADVLERSGAAGLALECDGAPYNGGAGSYDDGLETVQDDAGEALQNFLAEESFAPLPEEGYAVEREDDGRVLLSYDVGGDTKVAFVVAEQVTDWEGDTGWGIETWAQCDPAELPAAVTDDFGIGVWTDEDGRRLPVTDIVSRAGPEHCGWQDITFLVLDEERESSRLYLRVTTSELRDYRRSTFDPSATLPGRATDTGWQHAGRRLWLDPDGTAAYLVDTDDPTDVERWPATTEAIYCA